MKNEEKILGTKIEGDQFSDCVLGDLDKAQAIISTIIKGLYSSVLSAVEDKNVHKSNNSFL